MTDQNPSTKTKTESQAHWKYEPDFSARPPLVVDFDGALIREDLIHVALRDVISRDFFLGIKLAFNCFFGNKAYARTQVAQIVRHQPLRVTWNQHVLAWVRFQAKHKRRVILSTAAPQELAEEMAREVNIFDAVVGSTATVMNQGAEKAQHALIEYGQYDFDYVGGRFRDIPMWKICRHAIVVTNHIALALFVQKNAPIFRLFPAQPAHAERGELDDKEFLI